VWIKLSDASESAGFGFAAGAGLAGIVYSQMDYRSSAFAGAGIALITACLIWRRLPEPEIQK
jgi:predicted MFS family arabinose efflux permease